MRKILLILLVALGAGGALAQQDMETAVPSNWTAATGTLSISGNHYKSGTQSLRWDWIGGDYITVTAPGISGSAATDFYKNTCDFWVWNGAAISGTDHLRVDFIHSGTNGVSTAEYGFNFYLNFTGWRHAVRSFIYDMDRAANRTNDFTSVRISAPATGSGTFFIDAVRWAGDRFTRIRDAQNRDIHDYNINTTYSDALSYLPDLPLVTPTQAELYDLAKARSRWLVAAQFYVPTPSQVTAASGSFAALNIVEDTNGIRGPVFDSTSTGCLEGWTRSLAYDAINPNSPTATSSSLKMQQLTRHLLDQGFACNSNVTFNGYYIQYTELAMIAMSSLYDVSTRQAIWDTFYWNFLLGQFWSTNWTHDTARNTDAVQNDQFLKLGLILNLASDAEAVRMLKAHKRWVEQFVAPSDGYEDGIKPDGLGFHHWMHYNAYMGAFPALSKTLNTLRGTVFQVDATAYQRLRAAFLAMLAMSASGTANTTQVGYYANSMCGRTPFSTNLPMDRDVLRVLGDWGGQISGTTSDIVMAQAYNQRFGLTGPNSYSNFVPFGLGNSLDGYYQFNYSPLGIYRRANWVASMHGTGSLFASAEIYPSANRYGRYQAYGALEVLYNGGLAMSGEQLNGWDWNHPPGTTTIVLPDNLLVAEKDSEGVTSQINFCGALAFHDDQSGVYACNFREVQTGTAMPNHNPTFVWRKSWFCFENEIICLGSDIANNDSINPTVTTLFQGYLPTTSSPTIIDGNATTAFPYISTLSGTSGHWMLDCFTNGYYVQPGSDIIISRSVQSSPGATGSGTTTGSFATAWMNHGNAPSAAGYEYAVFPATTGSAMVANAALHSGTSKPYQIIERDATAHVVKWLPTGQIGYAIYSSSTPLPVTTQTTGLISSVGRPCLAMTQTGTANDVWLTVVDPDLNFVATGTEANAQKVSFPRTLNITLNKRCALAFPTTGVSIATTATSTVISATTQYGFSVDMQLILSGT